MKNLLLIIILLSVSTFYGCGSSNSSGASSTSPVVINGLSSVPAPASLLGTWSGYLDNAYATISIQANGNIVVTQAGNPNMQRLLYTQNSQYFILNADTRTGVPVTSYGNQLVVTINGMPQYFNKN